MLEIHGAALSPLLVSTHSLNHGDTPRMNDRSGHWEHFEHQADIGVRGCGPDLETAFAQAALALTAVITDPRRVRPQEAITIEVSAPDREFLLVEWLDALIYRMAVDKRLFSRFQVHIDPGHTHLQATAWGEPVDRERHQPAVEVKGATLTELKVWQPERGGWCAQCVVDV